MTGADVDVVFKGTLVLVASVTFIIIGVAEADLFRRPVGGPGRRLLVHHASVATLALGHVVVLAGSEQAARLLTVASIALYGAGLALFLWAQETVKHSPPCPAFSSDVPDHLVECGPFRFVRHPFYTACILVWSAGVVATLNPWLLASAVWMAIHYATAAAEEEAAFERTGLNGAYQAYRARTGMFVPRLWQGRRRMAAENGEARLLVAVVILGAVLLSAWLVWDTLRRYGG